MHGGYLWGIASASTRGKKHMRIFCKKAQEQIRVKCTVELLVLGQLGIVVVSTEVKLIFYSREPRMCVWGGGGVWVWVWVGVRVCV